MSEYGRPSTSARSRSRIARAPDDSDGGPGRDKMREPYQGSHGMVGGLSLRRALQIDGLETPRAATGLSGHATRDDHRGRS